MKLGLTAQLLIATSLTIMSVFAIANQEPMPMRPSNEMVQPERTEQTESQPIPESKPVLPVTGSRGQMLYENHCQECHTSVVHVREMRRVRSMDDLEHWVKRWADTLKLSWSKGDIKDVVDYLNQHYYKLSR